MLISQCPCSRSSMGILDVVVLAGIVSIIMLIVHVASRKKKAGTEDENEL